MTIGWNCWFLVLEVDEDSGVNEESRLIAQCSAMAQRQMNPRCNVMKTKKERNRSCVSCLFET